MSITLSFLLPSPPLSLHFISSPPSLPTFLCPFISFLFSICLFRHLCRFLHLCVSLLPPPPVSLSPSLPPAFLLFLSCNLCLSFLLLLFKLMIPFCLYVAVLSIVKLRDLANRKRPNRFASRPRRRGARPASLPRGVPLLLLCPKKINLWRKAHLEDMAVSAQGSSKPQSSLGLTFSVQTIVNQPKLKVADKFFSCSTTSL